MNVLGKLALALLFIVIAPIALAIFAAGCFVVTGLFTGMVLGLLDALGLLTWSNTIFLAVTIPLAVVVAIVCAIYRDELADW